MSQLTTLTHSVNLNLKKVKVRPIPDSLITKFGSELIQEDWSFLNKQMSSTELVGSFEQYTSSMVDRIFPEKIVTVSSRDKPFMTEELRLLRRQRQRVYRKGGRNDKYLGLLKKFEQKMKIEAEKYRQKILSEVAEGSRCNAYSALRKLETGEQVSKKALTLPSHADLTPAQSAEKLADYFSKISQEFDPINPENFPPWIKEKLLDGKSDPLKPFLEDWQVYQKLKKSKKPSSSIPGDIPVKLMKEFTPELSKPVATIYNRITQSGVYPRQWVVEYQVAKWPYPRRKYPCQKTMHAM